MVKLPALGLNEIFVFFLDLAKKTKCGERKSDFSTIETRVKEWPRAL